MVKIKPKYVTTKITSPTLERLRETRRYLSYIKGRDLSLSETIQIVLDEWGDKERGNVK